MVGNARQKLDHEGNALRIEKKLTQKRQYAQNNTKDEKSKKKDPENQPTVKYEDSRNIIGFEKSLKQGVS